MKLPDAIVISICASMVVICICASYVDRKVEEFSEEYIRETTEVLEARGIV
jgi:hypothetical protein